MFWERNDVKVNRKYLWIGIAILLLFSMSVNSVSAETICEGNVTAQRLVSDYFSYNDLGGYGGGMATMWFNANGQFVYDCDKKVTSFEYIAYNVYVEKHSAVRWFYDNSSPSADIIPDSVSDVTDIKNGTTTVGTMTITVRKVGCANPSDVNCLWGFADIEIDAEIDTNLLPAAGTVSLTGPILTSDSSIYDFYRRYETGRMNNGGIMWAFSGIAMGSSTDTEWVYGRTFDDSDKATGWDVNVYNKFKNYYTVTTSTSNITVQIQREGDDLGYYATKSKLRSYDNYGLLLTGSGWISTNKTCTLQLTPQYMYIVPNFNDETELFICNYGSTDTAKIYGYVYDAENESTIVGAKVEIDTHHSTYSDDSGFYLIRTDPGSHILTVTKDGYWDWQETIYFDYAGDYEINIPLIPKPPTYTGHGIFGTVRTLPYYRYVENQLVSIENTTWSDTTNTNNVGYYAFDNLEVGNYWINVSKGGYRDNNQSVTVSVTGDEIVTIDNCDATTNWSSNNSLALNTTDKQEGSGSLQSSGSSTMDFNKSAPSAIDASNVTKENGYMTFWYKINDTTRINDYLVFTVGSNGDNTTNKISWGVYKSNFVNDTWKEIWLKFSDGTEDGTLSMSNINWIEVKATKSDSVTSKIDNIRFYDFSYEIHDVDLDPILSLGVIAKTLDGEIIDTFTATLDNTTKNTTTGQELVFSDLHYGMKELTVTSEGYNPYQRSVYLDSDTNITAYLTKEAEGGAGVYYPPPHLVEFRVQTWQGTPFADVNVTAKGYSTTMGAWDWLYDIFGYKNETQIHNVTMSDTTDSNGAISFLMVETVKYKMTFTKGSEVNETIYLYPKEDHYKIIIGTKWVKTTSMWDVINYSILAGELNDTHAYINFSFVDANNKTSELYYFINQSNGTTTFNIYNHTYTGGDCANITNSYIVERGQAYFIGFEADNDDYGEIKHSLFIRIFEKSKRLLSFGDEVPDYIYDYISIGSLCLVAAFFGMITVPEGGIVLSLQAWILWFLGWFLWQNPLAPLYLTVATVFAILIIFAAKGRGKGVS